MTFRTKLIGTVAATIVLPLLALGLSARRQASLQLRGEYEERVRALVDVIRGDITRESESIAERLATLTEALRDDNRFRIGASGAVAAERSYVLDYASRAMDLAGFSMLQILNDSGRILSSGHFRNEFDRDDSAALERLLRIEGGIALVLARTPSEPFLAIARADSLFLGGRRYSVIGGVRADRRFLSRLVRGPGLGVSLILPGAVMSSDPDLEEQLRNDARGIVTILGAGTDVTSYADYLVGIVAVPYVQSDSPANGWFVVTQSLAPLHALLRSADRRWLLALLVTAILTFLAVWWISARLSHPLRALAAKTATVDLDRLNVDFDTTGEDEVGQLARILHAMTTRLRLSAVRLRDVERRAAVGDLARQVNHDIKNGLVPMWNVVRHLNDVYETEPDRLSAVFGERRHTVDSSISYLNQLATNYARLTPELDRRPCDVNEVVQRLAEGFAGVPNVVLETELTHPAPRVLADAVVLRRVLENLIENGVESIGAAPGSIVVSTEVVEPKMGDRSTRVTIADNGSGMTREQLQHAFEPFYSTKHTGTGLGLSIVRRLVLDLHGTLRVETEPGVGSRFIVELPLAAVSGAVKS